VESKHLYFASICLDYSGKQGFSVASDTHVNLNAFLDYFDKYQKYFKARLARLGVVHPHFMSTEARFCVKIGFKFQSLCKISNIFFDM